MNDALLSLREKAQIHQDASKAKRFRDRGGLWQPLSPSKNKLMALLNSGNLFKSNDDKSLATAAESPASPQKATKAVKRKPAPKKNKGKGKISDIEDGNVESSKPKVPRKAKSTKADIERDNIVARPSNGSGPTRRTKKNKAEVSEEQEVDNLEDIPSVQKLRGKQARQIQVATSTIMDVTKVATTSKAIETQNSSKKRAIAEATNNHDEESDHTPSPKKRQKKQPSTKATPTKKVKNLPKKLHHGKKIKARPSVSSNNDTMEASHSVAGDANEDKLDKRTALRMKSQKRQRDAEATSDEKTGPSKRQKQSNKTTEGRGNLDDYQVSDDTEYVPQKCIKPATSKPNIKTQENRLQNHHTVASENPVHRQLSPIMELDEPEEQSSVMHRISSRTQSVPSIPHFPSQIIKRPLENRAESGKTKRKRKKIEEPLSDLNYENIAQKTKPKAIQKGKTKTSQLDLDSLPSPSKRNNGQKEDDDSSVDGNQVRGKWQKGAGSKKKLLDSHSTGVEASGNVTGNKERRAKAKKGGVSACETGISEVVKVGTTNPKPKPKVKVPQAETSKNWRATIQSTVLETPPKLKINGFIEPQYLTQRREILDSDFDELDFLS